MAKTGLEERLEAVAREFVQRIVAEIRSASFAEVAGYAPQRGEPAESPAPTRAKAMRVVASPKRAAGASTGGGGGGGARQTAEKRAELSERVVEALRNAGEPLSARALATTLEVSTELLVQPLLELRAAQRIAKHGEKRATTYSIA